MNEGKKNEGISKFDLSAEKYDKCFAKRSKQNQCLESLKTPTHTEKYLTSTSLMIQTAQSNPYPMIGSCVTSR